MDFRMETTMAKGFTRFFGLAVVWAFIYALPAVPIEGLANLGIEFSFTYAVDMWPFELGLPGFVGGLFFAGLMALTGRLHRFESMPAGRLAAWGAAAGALVGVFYNATSWPNPADLVALTFAIAIGLGTLAGPLSALAFRLLARRRAAPARARA
jgi:hypothetical protein